MDRMRRWWGQHGLTVLLSGLALGSAWSVRQTQGSWLVETYNWVTAPFHLNLNGDQQSILQSAANQELQARLLELQHQNQELRRLLSLKQQLGNEGISAPVVGRNADHWWQQLTLGRGSEDGIKSGDIVTAPGGLIGRVESLTDNTSRVLLISDPTSRVGVMVSRGRNMGVMRGQGSQLAVLEFFDKQPSVQVGDAVLTSGLSSLYPSGIVIGKVRSVDLNTSPAPQAIVEITAPLGMMEWGVIYPYNPGRT